MLQLHYSRELEDFKQFTVMKYEVYGKRIIIKMKVRYDSA